MDDTLYSAIQDAITDRNDWATRQELYYRMRHRGLGRTNPPYPGAPNLHFPLIDTTIESIKPFYVQQLYTGEVFATFVSRKTQDSQLTSTVSGWFDYQLKEESNFEEEICSGIDGMQTAGRNPIKAYWDADCEKLAFDAIDPLHLIVPKTTREIKDADWLVHVMHLSVAEYKANANYNQDPDFIKSIKGKGTSQQSADNSKEQTVQNREGINYGKDNDEIVLWEVYDRDRKAKKITIETVSPVRPKDDNEVRAPFEFPYNKGAFESGERFPFFSLRTEIKDKGYYSPRGIPEILAPFEVSMCKLWNSKHETMDFFNRPTFTSDKAVPNTANIRMIPGGLLPPGIKPVEFPQPPVSFDQEMQNTRAAAEYRVKLPDLGAGEHLTASNGRGNGGRPTATQINAILGQSGQSTDLRARVFRKDLAEGFYLAYSILIQFKAESLQFILNDEIANLDPSAIHDAYQIVPNGSADSWNREAEFQKAVGMYQQLQGNPYVAPDELTKLVLEKGDPRWVKRLYRDPGIAQQDQAEAQNNEILLMLGKFAARVKPADDDKVHLQTLGQFGQVRAQEPEPLDPICAGLFLQHIQGHFQGLAQKKDPALRQIMAQMQPMVAILSQIAQSAPQQQAMPPNVVQGPGAAPMPSGQPMAPGQPHGTQPDPQADAAKVMTALAALAKTGAPVGPDQLNAVFQMAGLPPIQIQQPIQPAAANL